jgi:hypothetical protein
MNEERDIIHFLSLYILNSLEAACSENELHPSFFLKTLVYSLSRACLTIDLPPEKFKDILQGMVADYVRNYKVPLNGMD